MPTTNKGARTITITKKELRQEIRKVLREPVHIRINPELLKFRPLKPLPK